MTDHKALREAVEYFNDTIRFYEGDKAEVPIMTLLNLAQSVLDGKLCEPMGEGEIGNIIIDFAIKKYSRDEKTIHLIFDSERMRNLAHILSGKVSKPEMSRSEIKSIIRCIDFSAYDRAEMSKGKLCEVIADALLVFPASETHSDFAEHNQMTLPLLAEHLGVELWKAMEIARCISIRPQVDLPVGEKSDDKFIEHIQSHLRPDQEVICKICGKTAREITG